MPNAKAKGRGRTKLGKTGQSITPRPLERRVGPRIGPTLRPPTEPKRKRAAQPETRAMSSGAKRAGRLAPRGVGTPAGWNKPTHRKRQPKPKKTRGASRPALLAPLGLCSGFRLGRPLSFWLGSRAKCRPCPKPNPALKGTRGYAFGLSSPPGFRLGVAQAGVAPPPRPAFR